MKIFNKLRLKITRFKLAYTKSKAAFLYFYTDIPDYVAAYLSRTKRSSTSEELFVNDFKRQLILKKEKLNSDMLKEGVYWNKETMTVEQITMENKDAN